ncbi:hypothetical protein [Candidatus Venteria ishoeyi]|uniref:Uncharacterized protein n=1 Tax=Candidatus Venteria ishoeyi TaxID=1899563 RepID=A0A1H6FC56_9GAMM|nr:hypothetical protein [Candidatus Venteria ishoeyi]SEH07672.1 Uncharacterised protein [Candidatus Venteria ishoeyi]
MSVSTANNLQLPANSEDYLMYEHKQAGGQWLLCVVDEADGKITLENLACELEMVDIYTKVELK